MKEIGYLRSPVGVLRITIDSGAVEEITNHVSEEEADMNMNLNLKKTDDGDSAVMETVKTQLTEYFDGKRQSFAFAMAPAGTDFQKQVWKVLLEIPFGKTLSYHQVAERIGNPKASRAVGGAVGANPILIAIPCHRIIRGDGSLGGFSAGLDNKVILHELEGISCRN